MSTGHKKLETNISLMAIFIIIAVSLGGLVEILPLIFLDQVRAPAEGVKPYPALQLAGRDVYIREGCYNCHSQMIRPFRSETERYGPYSLAGESVYDRPFQWGSKRTGPDLARVGGRYSDEWQYIHMNNPRDVVPESNMPAYPWLSDAVLTGNDTAAKMKALNVAVSATCPKCELYSEEEMANAKEALMVTDFNAEGGKRMATEAEALVEQINRSGADILLLGLGNPKQELWFNRNRHRLEVPVSIGVGGTFEFIVGTVRRAPAWMQRCNLEWLFRITQDPARLWRRYAVGMFKLFALSAPLAWARLSQEIAFRTRVPSLPCSPRWRHVWSSRDASLDIVRLPEWVGSEYLEQLIREVQAADKEVMLSLLDFSRVRHVALEAHHALFTLAELQRGVELLRGLVPAPASGSSRRSTQSARVRSGAGRPDPSASGAGTRRLTVSARSPTTE